MVIKSNKVGYMSALERYKKSKYILSEIENCSNLQDIAKIISSSTIEIKKSLYKSLSSDQNTRITCAVEIQKELKSISEKLKRISHRAIYREMDQLQDLLDKMEVENIDSSGIIKKTKTSLKDFAAHYEAYAAGYDPTHAIPLIYSAIDFSNNLESIIISNTTALDDFNNEGETPLLSHESELSLYLSTITSVDDFAKKLHALSELYAALAKILDVDITDSPLRIGNIESGSLWSRVFGDSKVIQLIVDFLRGGASYLHRTYTTEGKISGIPSSLDSLNRILDFSKRLEDEGVDTASMKEELRIAGVSIARNFNSLLEKQYRVEVNGEEHSLQSAAMKAISQESWMETLRISHEENSDTSES